LYGSGDKEGRTQTIIVRAVPAIVQGGPRVRLDLKDGKQRYDSKREKMISQIMGLHFLRGRGEIVEKVRNTW